MLTPPRPVARAQRRDADGDEDEVAGSSFGFLSAGCSFGRSNKGEQPCGARLGDREECGCVTPGYLEGEEIALCERQQVVRFSDRLLTTLSHDWAQGRRACWEIAAPSVCLRAAWCRAHELSPRLFDQPTEGNQSVAVSPRRWKELVDGYVGAGGAAERQAMSRFFYPLDWYV